MFPESCLPRGGLCCLRRSAGRAGCASNAQVRETPPVPIDASETTSDDVRAFGEHCRREALVALADDNWHDVYRWTKGWVTSGGGAWLPDSWILYAVSALLKGEPRNAVHALDLGLGKWISGPRDRVALRWCRGDSRLDAAERPEDGLEGP